MATDTTNILKGVTLQQESDKTKIIIIQPGSGSTTGTSTTLTAAQTANRIVTLPDATTTLVGNDTSDALSNKTSISVDNLLLDGNTVSSINTNGNIILDPNGTGSVDVSNARITSVGTPTAPTDAVNKSYADGISVGSNFDDSTFRIRDDGDATKQLAFQVSGVTTGTTRTLTVPNASTTIVGTDNSQLIQNKQLEDSTTSIVDNADNTKILKFEVSGVTTGTTRTLTVPNVSTTIAGTDATQSFSNKSFSDAITGAQIATPSNPSAGNDKLYFKSDDKLYRLTSAGVETEVGSSPITPYSIKNAVIRAQASANTLVISLLTAAGSTPTASDFITIAFTDIVGSTVTELNVTSNTQLTISSGSTLGHVSNIDNFIYVYAVNDAGTVRLAASSVLFDESYPHTMTAEGGAGAADSANVLYWGVAGAGSKVTRLLGRFVSNQTTAGTWASDPVESITGFQSANIYKNKNTITVTNANLSIASTHQNDQPVEQMLFSTGGAVRTLSLPPVANCYGRVFTITKIDSGAGVVSLDPNGTETINGLTLTNLAIQYESITIKSNGVSWSVLNRYIPSVWTTFTVTTSLTTNVTNQGFFRRIGDSAEIMVCTSFNGTNTQGAYTITLPNGLSFDSNKYFGGVTQNNLWGIAKYYDASATGELLGSVTYDSTTTVAVWVIDDAAASTNYCNPINSSTNVPVTVANNDRIVVHFMIPISGWDG